MRKAGDSGGDGGGKVLAEGMGQGQVVNHPVFGPGMVRVIDLGNAPVGQVAGTVELMKQRVMEDSKDPWFQQHVSQVLPHSDNQVDIAKAAWAHVKGNMRFVQDRELAQGLRGTLSDNVVDESIEWSMSPKNTARYVESGIAAGDCDCFQEYLAGLLTVAGIPCSFVTVAANPEAPELESHVYVVAYPGGNRLPLDPSHGEWAGWEVPNMFNQRTEWPVQGGCGIGTLVMIAAVAIGAFMLGRN